MTADTDADAAIRVRDLTKRYGDNLACDSINLSVPSGTTFGLLGPNGAGKSTFIRMLMGLTAIDAGHIELLGENVSFGSKAWHSSTKSASSCSG